MNELRSYRESRGWTQTQLASAINIFMDKKTGKPTNFTRQRICDFERGFRSIPPRVEWFISDAG